MKLSRTIKAKKDNYFEFPGTIFVFTYVNIRPRRLFFKGIAIDQITPKKHLGYKDSYVNLEVLNSFSVLLFLVSFISSKLVTKLIKRYLEAYKDSQIVDTTFDHMQYGTKLGYIDFQKFSNPSTCGETCASIVNYLSKSNFKNKSIKHSMHSFEDKSYSIAVYNKIS
ncbi:hypothetical protein [Clostridium sp.]|uniref:hypothetical protein n=1 Tax=Clostridium sp. TaxID=1506 RepID=UPI001B713F0C|nr:hypothetical protein [Clostridium sp.]MBP3914977.1 hypothetical protein [Clostridium sp.]